MSLLDHYQHHGEKTCLQCIVGSGQLANVILANGPEYFVVLMFLLEYFWLPLWRKLASPAGNRLLANVMLANGHNYLVRLMALRLLLLEYY